MCIITGAYPIINWFYQTYVCHLPPPPPPPQNMESSCNPIVTKPKPKVEPPKDTATEKKEGEGEAGKMEGDTGKMEGEAGKAEGAGGEGESGAKDEGGDTGTQVTEEKMEDDPPKVEQTEDMDLD